MTKKPLKRLECKDVFYDAKHWNLLNNLRAKAIRVMEALEKFRLEAIVHGSIARGDVTEKSDIDIFIPHQPSSFIVETALEQAGIPIKSRLVVQATPSYAMKAYIELGENTSVSFS
ncbi:DNA polymerase subunit beta, partial [Candidatus Bathyarchaeota archaeon]